jgi:acyl carrier protein
MEKKDFLKEIEEIIEADENTLDGSEVLEGLDGWDSLAVMGFIAMVDDNFQITIEVDKIAECETVNDLVDLLGDRITG